MRHFLCNQNTKMQRQSKLSRQSIVTGNCETNKTFKVAANRGFWSENKNLMNNLSNTMPRKVKRAPSIAERSHGQIFDGFYFETLPMIRKVELGFVSPQFLLVWPPTRKKFLNTKQQRGKNLKQTRLPEG